MRLPLRILSVAVLLTVVRGGLAALTGPVPTAGYLGWLALANLVIASILLALADRSQWRGGRLAVGLFIVALGVGSVGTLIEAVLFRLFPLATVGRLGLSAVLVDGVGALAAARLARPAGGDALPPAPVSPGRQVARFVGCALAYTFCYLVAGIAVLPYVREFYQTAGLPSGGATLAMQLFVRGPLLVAIGILVTRMTIASRREQALLVALVMAGLGGAAPLLVPNPFLPDAVRWAHMVEITASNALFGALVGWVYGRRG